MNDIVVLFILYLIPLILISINMIGTMINREKIDRIKNDYTDLIRMQNEIIKGLIETKYKHKITDDEAKVHIKY